MKVSSKSKKKKSTQNIEPTVQSFIDQQQIATQNLFNASNYIDHAHYEKDFNGMFDMFKSVDLSQNNHNKSIHNFNQTFTKYNSTIKDHFKHQQKNYNRHNQRLQQSKLLIKLYETLPEQNSSKSPTLRIRKQKILQKKSNQKRKNIKINSFKSDSVFVGKKNVREQMNIQQKKLQLEDFLKLKNNQNSLILKKNQNSFTIKKEQTSSLRKNLGILTFKSPKKKTQVLNKNEWSILQELKTFSPQNKPITIFAQYKKIKRLQSLNTVRPLSKTTLYPSSKAKKGKQEEDFLIKREDLKELSKTMRITQKKQIQPTRYNLKQKYGTFF